MTTNDNQSSATMTITIPPSTLPRHHHRANSFCPTCLDFYSTMTSTSSSFLCRTELIAGVNPPDADTSNTHATRERSTITPNPLINSAPLPLIVSASTAPLNSMFITAAIRQDLERKALQIDTILGRIGVDQRQQQMELEAPREEGPFKSRYGIIKIYNRSTCTK
jgi:hypothetical protein